MSENNEVLVPHEVVVPTTSVHVPSGVPVQTWMTYSLTRPLEVAMTFTSALGPVRWVFGRNLLTEALAAGAAGEGDVCVQRAPELRAGRPEMLLQLQGANQARAAMLFDRSTLEWFVATTALLVPLGSETVAADLDAELRALLG